MSSIFFCGSFTKNVTIWSMSVCTSMELSMSMMLPLSLVTYLLTADCESPRICAVCFSLSPCFSTMVLAIMAFTAGKIVFTPTSHGNSNLSPDYCYFEGENYLNMAIVIRFYDACHDGALNRKATFYTQSLTPYPVTTPP